MGWTSPKNWEDQELVTADALNTHLRDNLLHLYNELPQRASLWHGESLVTTGNGIAMVTATSQLYNLGAAQNPAADADEFTQSFILAAGTYTLRILGQSGPGKGKIDWYLDGQLIATGQDWYAASDTHNVIKSVSNVQIAEGGRHVLTGTVNGKNGSSSGYQIWLTKMWLVPAADSE